MARTCARGEADGADRGRGGIYLIPPRRAAPVAVQGPRAPGPLGRTHRPVGTAHQAVGRPHGGRGRRGLARRPGAAPVSRGPPRRRVRRRRCLPLAPRARPRGAATLGRTGDARPAGGPRRPAGAVVLRPVGSVPRLVRLLCAPRRAARVRAARGVRADGRVGVGRRRRGRGCRVHTPVARPPHLAQPARAARPDVPNHADGLARRAPLSARDAAVVPRGPAQVGGAGADGGRRGGSDTGHTAKASKGAGDADGRRARRRASQPGGTSPPAVRNDRRLCDHHRCPTTAVRRRRLLRRASDVEPVPNQHRGDVAQHVQHRDAVAARGGAQDVPPRDDARVRVGL